MTKHRPYLASVRYLTQARHKLETMFVPGDWPNITRARKYRAIMRRRGYRVSIIKESIVHEVVS